MFFLQTLNELKAKTPQKGNFSGDKIKKSGKNKDFVMVVYMACICNWLRTYFLIVTDFIVDA